MQTEFSVNEVDDRKITIRSKLKDEIKSLALHIEIIKNKQSLIDQEHVHNCQLEIAKIRDLEIELVENEQKISDFCHQDSHSSEFMLTTANPKSIIGLKIENAILHNGIIKTKQDIDIQMKINLKLEEEVSVLTKKNTDCHDAMHAMIDVGINLASL